jgi:TetR/AcrR family transcriptional regulator of autoinduction and epiphytic fitness
VKGFAFWPQVMMGQPSLTADEQKTIAESSADMFLARYVTGSNGTA